MSGRVKGGGALIGTSSNINIAALSEMAAAIPAMRLASGRESFAKVFPARACEVERIAWVMTNLLKSAASWAARLQACERAGGEDGVEQLSLVSPHAQYLPYGWVRKEIEMEDLD